MKRLELAARRKAAGYTQEDLADALGVGYSTVRRWESGESDPQPWAQPELAKLLNISAGELYELLAGITGANTSGNGVGDAIGSDELLRREVSTNLDSDAVPLQRQRGRPSGLWYVTEQEQHTAGVDGSQAPTDATSVPGAEAPLSRPPALPVALPEEPTLGSLGVVAHTLYANIRADGVVGSGYLLPAVLIQAPLIDRLLEATRGEDRTKVLRVGADLAEFCGWLYQDAGDLECALSWTNRALDCAKELDDPHLKSYFLMRKSNIVLARGRPVEALGLVSAALTREDVLAPRLKAVSLRQRANVHAHLGNRRDFEAETERAVDDAMSGEQAADDVDKAPYCTPSYVEMETGVTWVELDRPEKAVTILEHSLARWPETGRPIERGLCLARLAVAQAAAGEREQAARAASEALVAARQSGSARIKEQLTRAHRLMNGPTPR